MGRVQAAGHTNPDLESISSAPPHFYSVPASPTLANPNREQVERYEGNLHESFATWEEAAAFVGPLAALPAQPGLWGHGKVV